MKPIYLGIALTSISILFTACGSTQNALAEKDNEIQLLKADVSRYQQIAEREQDLSKNLKQKSQQTDQLNNELKTTLKDLETEKKLRIENDRIVMTNAILFASGSVRISDEGKVILDRIWDVIVKYPEREIFIEGHTDNMPIAKKYEGKYRSNWDLSTSRSLAVLHHVKNHPKATPSRLRVLGYGETLPVADNSTEEGRMQNRRVEIVIGRKLPVNTPPK
ncbi:flagellar motor protein MotB [bacterium]|nr:flagellar motor protein MotB [bacterium]MBU1064189.1 flagellar motor protein MotB [bacterium]MBU1633740.1 flagellar motor protein MotB [bacterium]MBU1874360.1 flagellar motor protein MotB [bacterium]